MPKNKYWMVLRKNGPPIRRVTEHGKEELEKALEPLMAVGNKRRGNLPKLFVKINGITVNVYNISSIDPDDKEQSYV